MGSVERFCDRGLVLEKGRIVDMGPPSRITRTYSELNFGHPAGDDQPQGPARVTNAWCESPTGDRIVSAEQGEQVVAGFEVEFDEPVEDPRFSVIFRNDHRHTIFIATSEDAADGFGAGDRATVRISFENRLAPSRYTLTPCVGPRDGGHDTYDAYARADDLAALAVHGRVTGGVLDLPVRVEVERE